MFVPLSLEVMVRVLSNMRIKFGIPHFPVKFLSMAYADSTVRWRDWITESLVYFYYDLVCPDGI